MDLEQEKTKTIMQRMAELNKKKAMMAYRINRLMDKLCEVSAELGTLSAELKDEEPNKN